MSDDEDFEREYPELSRELREERTIRLRIRGVRQQPDSNEEAHKTVKQFTPAITDFIRRCDTVAEAMEIVDYMLRRREITETEAERIRTQLKESGLRSFGSKKEPGHYLKHGLE